MKTLGASLLVLAACQAAPAQAGPAKPLDPQDPKSVIEHAVARTRSRKSYEVAWTARLQVPMSNALDYKGICVWASPGLLYLHYTASGGDDKKIVRIGEQMAWIHDVFAHWQPADVVGFPGAGRGFQNPDEILRLLAKGPGTSKLIEKGTVELTLGGADLEKMMAEQSYQGSFDWSTSKASVTLSTDADGRLKKLSCAAALTSTDPNVKGQVDYTAALDVVGYDAKSELEFKDEKNRVIPLNKAMLDAIEKLRKENP